MTFWNSQFKFVTQQKMIFLSVLVRCIIFLFCFFFPLFNSNSSSLLSPILFLLDIFFFVLGISSLQTVLSWFFLFLFSFTCLNFFNSNSSSLIFPILFLHNISWRETSLRNYWSPGLLPRRKRVRTPVRPLRSFLDKYHWERYWKVLSPNFCSTRLALVSDNFCE